MRVIEIWQPRWHDRVVLVDVKKVKEGTNYLRFTKAPSLGKGLWSFDGTTVRRECELDSNGKLECFAVPLYMLVEVKEKPAGEQQPTG